MTALVLWKKGALLLGLGTLATALLLGVHGRAVSQAPPAPPEKDEWKNCKYQNAVSCASCHTQPTGNNLRAPGQKRALDVVLMTEYAIWKTHDKHAQAYAVLAGPRGKLMARLLGQDVLKKETGCLNCHAMSNLAGHADAGGLDLKDGVSCGGCHGPSSEWLGPHALPTWRDKTAEEKHKLGMRNLRDPLVRAELCYSCHIGNAREGKVVTHAMFAAGHPPLPPIELATFSKNEPQHWRNSTDVPYFKENARDPKVVANYQLTDADFHQTRFAVVGALAALRATANLARDRVPGAPGDAISLWPELQGEGKLASSRWAEIAMAHSDCFACHHDLKYPGFRQQRGFGYELPGHEIIRATPGRPLVRGWPLALLEPALQTTGQGTRTADLEQRLKELARASNARPFGKPDEISKASGDLADWSESALKALSDPTRVKFDSASVLQLMHRLCQVGQRGKEQKTPYLPDQESARQLASVLKVAYDDWSRKNGKIEALTPLLTRLTDMVDAEPFFKRPERTRVTFGIVTQGQNPQGQEAFEKYLQGDLGDSASLLRMTKVSEPISLFLLAVRGISNDDFNAGLIKNADALQKLSDAEQEKLLKTIGAFDPKAFLSLLRDIDEKLPSR